MIRKPPVLLKVGMKRGAFLSGGFLNTNTSDIFKQIIIKREICSSVDWGESQANLKCGSYSRLQQNWRGAPPPPPPASKILRFSDIWICGIGDIADRVLMTTQGLYASLTIINTSLTVIRSFRSLSAVSPIPQIHISENLRFLGGGGGAPANFAAT